ncbi:AraC family transcriptional regulator [Treponema sp.]|uniref:helix-turn-helix domain-containing protein n=1 Tax=Treponema sp. TaxID=166 RepID=UPI00257E07CD|nr:AraC family transcriptional regulator [Treponema sp.]MBE6354870.1 helix-turn-helix transcriptional regulator [Treponema sp.]
MQHEYFILSCGRVRNPSNWFYNPAYIVNRIYYISSGTAYYKNNYQLKPGFLYIFRANPDFRVAQDESDPVDHTYFDFLTYKKLLLQDFIEIDLSNNSMLFHLVKAMEEDFVQHQIDRDLSCAYFDLLIHALNQYLLPDITYSETTSAVLKMIHKTPTAELSVDYIAEHCNRNVNHVIRTFKNELGITPHKYISMLKIDQAISYMRQGLNCTEISELLGFQSLSAFSYFFKKETGNNPTDLFHLQD